VNVAKMQIESADLVIEFRTAGIPYHGLAALSAGMEEMFDRLIALQKGSPNEMTREELRKTLCLITKTAPDFEVLLRCDLRETLNHGDLNQSNAFTTGTGETVLIDWALSRVTHPFFVLGSALFGPYTFGHGKQPDYDDLCDAYLEPWCDFQEHDRLRAGLDAASRLFWIDSTIAISSLCIPGHTRNLVNLPRFLRATLRAYELLG
ncbi:MAG: aminoglycoside phosphotransferase family protein, partial [Candidatus Sulfotelmatobacter sp.]|nr:aminoglycoside phosphotransferase family protein [Candidatus Sulfotelmatobacter sp.]